MSGTYPPSEEFQRNAVIASEEIYTTAEADLEGFWAAQADTHVTWFKKWDTVLEWTPPFAKWFTGGELNISYNCLDRHVEAGFGDKVAFFWEGEPGDSREVTYQDLLDETSRIANALRQLGVKKGDRVAIYLPMVPELPATMLACARIGAPHTVVFAGFSADSLSGRINDAEAKVLVTADGGWRRG
ncbi:MAG: AMP-binding protein, partial [Actinomycetota bacterium]